jgi:hypothetical protein
MRDAEGVEKRDEFIRDNYPAMPVPEIAKAIDKSESTVRQRLKKLGLTKAGKPRPRKVAATLDSLTLTVDFGQIPKLLEYLKQWANDEFRTPEQQMLQLLSFSIPDFYKEREFPSKEKE